jgi:enoyl-CoA hydratase
VSGVTGVDGLRLEVADRVLTLTIDRPEAKNALTVVMRQRIERLADEVDDDDTVDVVVLTAVDPVFSAGADIKEIVARGAALPPTNPGGALRSIAKPVIAAVNGACVTGGLELMLSCDIAIASDRARFADTHAKLGALPRWGMSALLPRAVGLARAKEITATGAFVDADEALRIGLVNHVVPHDDLQQRTRELAAAIVGGQQRAIRASIDLYDRGNGLPLADALALEAEVCGAWTVDTSTFGVKP